MLIVLSVIREKRAGINTECKGAGEDDFNKVDRKASEEVIFEKRRRPLNFEV